MDARENDGRNVPRLDRVQRGEPITADAWNQIVDAINRPVDVSIKRSRRPKGTAAGTSEQLTVVTDVSVDSSGNLVFSTVTKNFFVEE